MIIYNVYSNPFISDEIKSLNRCFTAVSANWEANFRALSEYSDFHFFKLI